VEWLISDAAVPYPAATAAMEARVADIAAHRVPELVWLLEHPPLYTSGTSGKAADLLDPRFPMFETGRGGQLTYHGPGQRVAYVMLDLKRRQPDVRAYVAGLEQWIIRTLAAFNVRGERREDRVGVWVARPDKGEGFEDKIAAIGVRLRHWVSFHGISINVEPDLTPLCGHCPLRRGGPTLWRDQPRRSRPCHELSGSGYGAPAGFRGSVWCGEAPPAGSDVACANKPRFTPGDPAKLAALRTLAATFRSVAAAV